ncbi:cytochrome P450 [Pterulicium gracile]|uniref:Cytochrome P450 n=1 Tax=Pterulicium gracile TaxID=1884261 RepID=A0A5C3Q001_9AGAR|nr:cytochrome P450 [Pterula gracilis]
MLHAFTLVVEAAVLYCVWLFIRGYVIPSTLRNIPGPKRASLLTGNLSIMFSPQGIPWHLSMSRVFGKAFKINGWFGDEQLYVTDPLALHHIVIKDQHIYEETSMFIHGNRMSFGHGLLGALGDTHRKQRKILNPVFSNAQMRNLAPIFYSLSQQLCDRLERTIDTLEFTEVNMRPWLSKISLEIIGEAGFGYSFGSFGGADRGNNYRAHVKDYGRVIASLALPRFFLPFFTAIGSPGFLRMLLNLTPSRRLHKLRDIVDAMDKTCVGIYEDRKKEVGDGEDRQDIISVLLRANQAAEAKDRLSDEELRGQINTLVFAGSDTTLSALSRVLHLLALHPDVQSKLRAEVVQARRDNAGDDLDYDVIAGLPYLDAITRETLRLHSPVTFLSRTTRADISLPLSKPILSTSGHPISAVPLKNNTNVIIGIAAANRDKDMWGEDADEWKPERWLNEDGSVRVTATKDADGERFPGVYSGMMTFLGGSRACIGFKFSQLEFKVVVSMLLERFEFQLPVGKEIGWRNSVVTAPILKGEFDGAAQLPLMVRFIKRDGI